MSIVPQASGLVSSAAGSSLSQTGASAERSGRDGATTDRVRAVTQAAEVAAGVGKSDADQETGDRDADGRRMGDAPEKHAEAATAEEQTPHRPADPKGVSGNSIDLVG